MGRSHLPACCGPGKLGFTSSGWSGAQWSQAPWVPATMGVATVPCVLVFHTDVGLPALSGAVTRTEAEAP